MISIEDFKINKVPWRKSKFKKPANFFKANLFIESLYCMIIHGGNKCYYIIPSPIESFPNHISGDIIRMPILMQFLKIEEYYFNLFHEISHWSEIRLKLSLNEMESELIAEIVSNLLCNKFYINQNCLLNYEKNLIYWIKEFEKNENFIKKCFKTAKKIVLFLQKVSLQNGYIDL